MNKDSTLENVGTINEKWKNFRLYLKLINGNESPE